MICIVTTGQPRLHSRTSSGARDPLFCRLTRLEGGTGTDTLNPIEQAVWGLDYLVKPNCRGETHPSTAATYRVTAQASGETRREPVRLRCWDQVPGRIPLSTGPQSKKPDPP